MSHAEQIVLTLEEVKSYPSYTRRNGGPERLRAYQSPEITQQVCGLCGLKPSPLALLI